MEGIFEGSVTILSTETNELILMTFTASLGRQGLPIPPQTNLQRNQISEGVFHQRTPPNKRASPQHPGSRQTNLPNPHPEELHLAISRLSRSSPPPILNLHHSLRKPVVTTPRPPARRDTSSSTLRPGPRWSPRPESGTAGTFVPGCLCRIRTAPYIREDLCVCIWCGCYSWTRLGTGRCSGVVGETGYLGSCYSCWWWEWNC